MMRTTALILALGLIAAVTLSGEWRQQRSGGTPAQRQPGTSDSQLQHAFENQQSNLQVEGRGIVIKLLPDDRQGSRHQRFLLQLSHGQVLLVAHNIDLAPRIDALREGDPVAFFGEYEWNAQGGVIHWTHRDPGKRHADGWLRHAGKLYQ